MPRVPATESISKADVEVGPHIGLTHAWPMSLLIQAQTSDNDTEIMECVELVLNSCKLGLVHESVDVNRIGAYTSERYEVPCRVYRL